MPSSRSSGRISASGSLVHSEYSVCKAEAGWTAWRRTTLESPGDRGEGDDLGAARGRGVAKQDDRGVTDRRADVVSASRRPEIERG
jgi:hypothetical protein